MKLVDMSEEMQERYCLENRVDYAQKMFSADKIIEEYMKWEQSREEKERKQLYIYRRTGKIALTWGWFMESLQKEETEGEGWNREVLKICSKVLNQDSMQNQDTYEKLLTTIVFTLFVYPCTKSMGALKKNQRRMMERIRGIFPWMTADICEYPGIISQMKLFENISFKFAICCLNKWKSDGDKEQEVGDFIRHGKFIREQIALNGSKPDHFRYMFRFMEEYTAESRIWQESYAFLLIRRIQCFDNSPDGRFTSYHSDTKRIVECVEEQFEKLSKKGINLLESFFKYKNMQKSWGYRDINKIKFFLTAQKGKTCSLSAEELDPFVKQFGCDVGNHLVLLLDRCQIIIEDKTKLYDFQMAICLYLGEEELVKYYQKGLLPKEILGELILCLGKRKQIEKIPLLLQWIHGEEENDQYII